MDFKIYGFTIYQFFIMVVDGGVERNAVFCGSLRIDIKKFIAFCTVNQLGNTIPGYYIWTYILYGSLVATYSFHKIDVFHKSFFIEEMACIIENLLFATTHIHFFYGLDTQRVTPKICILIFFGQIFPIIVDIKPFYGLRYDGVAYLCTEVESQSGFLITF